MAKKAAKAPAKKPAAKAKAAPAKAAPKAKAAAPAKVVAKPVAVAKPAPKAAAPAKAAKAAPEKALAKGGVAKFMDKIKAAVAPVVEAITHEVEAVTAAVPEKSTLMLVKAPKEEKPPKAPKEPKAKKPKRVVKAKAGANTADDEGRWVELFGKHGDEKPQVYDMKAGFVAGKSLQHKSLGWGWILSNENDRLEVLFKDGRRMLISNYNPNR